MPRARGFDLSCVRERPLVELLRFVEPPLEPGDVPEMELDQPEALRERLPGGILGLEAERLRRLEIESGRRSRDANRERRIGRLAVVNLARERKRRSA